MSNRLDDAVADYYANNDSQIAEDYLEKYPEALAAWFIKSASRELWDKMIAEFLNDVKSPFKLTFDSWADEYIREMLESSQYPDTTEEERGEV